MSTLDHRLGDLVATRRSGLTRVEVIVVLLAVGLLMALVLCIIARKTAEAKAKAQRIACISNLKHIGLSFRVYAHYNQDRYPMHGWGDAFEQSSPRVLPSVIFGMMSNELNTPRILACPADKRKSAADWRSFTPSNISYFVGLDATDERPLTLLGGDRNLTANEIPVGPGLLAVTTNTVLGWTAEIHKNRGQVLLGEGSVRLFTDSTPRPRDGRRLMPETFQEQVGHQGIATNWLSIP